MEFSTPEDGQDSRVEVTVIPAQPGWSVVSVDSESKKLWHRAILAWQIETRTFVNRYPNGQRERIVNSDIEAITTDGNSRLADHQGIKAPDGTITIPYLQRFEGEADFVKYCTEAGE